MGIHQNTTPERPDAEPDSQIWLSIITPVLNGARYIGSCIENVAGQNAPGVEHIVMDGKSTDETAVIARRLAAIHPSLRVYSEDDGSQAAAMNSGVRLARGRVIGFLNVDDFYQPNLLPRIAEIFAGLPEPSLVVGNCNFRDAADNILTVNRPSRLTLLDFLKGREFPWNPSAYFYHKALHDLVGGYDEKEHYVLDVDFLFRAVQKARVCYFDEVWGNFRWMAGTKTYEDDQAGRMLKRGDELRRRYSAQLSFTERLRLKTFCTVRPFFRRVRRRVSCAIRILFG